MKWSHTFIPTLKEAPKDAEISSHQLMLRAGFIQALSSGLYIYLPLGLKVLSKVQAIIREVLAEHGAIELNMPALQPRAIWEKSGRWDALGDLMMKITDRDDREFVLGPTHEEIITDLVSKRVNSYKELPLNFYQIQTKFRDEIRPRFGLIRAKEFIMKDGYSFDLSREGTLKSYENMKKAYYKLFDRMELKTHAVEADTGAMGDSGQSHEFVALTPIGEDTIAFCSNCGYAANLEMAKRKIEMIDTKDSSVLNKVHTPGVTTVSEVASFLKIDEKYLVKTLLYSADNNKVAVLIRGDIEVNEVKLKAELKVEELFLEDERAIQAKWSSVKGFSGPIKLSECQIIADESVRDCKGGVVGSNELDYHYSGFDISRDIDVDTYLDVGVTNEGDLCVECNHPLHLKKGIEVGHIFVLGQKYSEKLGAKVSDVSGKEVTLDMGCYGIGVSRILAALVEANFDNNGICWPTNVAPFHVVICAIDYQKNQLVAGTCDELYEKLTQVGFDVLLDDRKERPGVKFADAELIGIPYRLVIGKRSLETESVEVVERRSGQKNNVQLDQISKFLSDKISLD